ncbi:MAG: DUF1315 family protein [Gammaproteobacteria bacterium]|nr:DUF1315 family protein [Gammaproteobacteria bacterium]
MDLKDVLSAMTPEIRERLSTAIEVGRWPDGSKLTEQQKSSSIQAVIAWDAHFGKITDEPFKVQKGGKLNSKINKTSAIKQN